MVASEAPARRHFAEPSVCDRLAFSELHLGENHATKFCSSLFSAQGHTNGHILSQSPNGSVFMNDTRPLRTPDSFDASTLAKELALRIAGSPADGSVPAALIPPAIVWVDAGSEVLAHLDSIQARLLDGTLLVSIDLETDQTGRSPLIIALTISADPKDPAGLIATTDEHPRGHGQLAARWGRPLQAAVWASLLSIAQDHAAERSGAPQSITITANGLTLQAGPPLSLTPHPSPGPRNNHDDDDDKRTTSAATPPS
jgi:hypothetical protein